MATLCKALLLYVCAVFLRTKSCEGPGTPGTPGTTPGTPGMREERERQRCIATLASDSPAILDRFHSVAGCCRSTPKTILFIILIKKAANMILGISYVWQFVKRRCSPFFSSWFQIFSVAHFSRSWMRWERIGTSSWTEQCLGLNM